MSFTLPTAPPAGTYSDLSLDDRHLLRFDTMVDFFEDGTELEVQCALVLCFPRVEGMRSTQYLIAGLGSTPSDALLAMFADEEIDGLRIPAKAAAALDELAHQAVRVVCQRLSGGTLDDATFTEPHLLDTQSGPVAVPTVGAAPDPRIPLGGDTAMSTLSGEQPSPELFGGIE